MPERRAAHEREAAFAARWAAGEWRGQTLAALTGERYTVIYEGRPGGGAGPDFRDAVLAGPDGCRVCGDVELHLQPEGWRAHGHQHDPRYNALALHVAIYPSRSGGPRETTLASGRVVPLVLLSPPSRSPCATSAWPCTGLARRLSSDEVRALLVTAGMARFHLRAEHLAAQLHAGGRDERALPWRASDRVLFVALGEALAYGRDRAALREAGERLLAGDPPATVALFEQRLPRVEAQRLRGLLALFARWRLTGPWVPLRQTLSDGPPLRAARALVARLRVPGGLVSPGRAAIVAANVVLPFAAAMAACAGDAALAARVATVYAVLPGLPSNAITRLMARQLGLVRQPRGAVAHLGLQHLWAESCREKRCDTCPCRLCGPPRHQN